MEYMATCKDKEFDLAVVDPPYGIGVGIFKPVGNRGEDNKDDKEWDKAIPTEKYFQELRRVSKEQIIWGANYFNCFSGNMGAIIWNKRQPLPDSSQCEIASYSRLKKVGLYEQRWTNFVNTKMTEHPTEKPIELYNRIYANYSKPKQKILDTHLGSGSSAISAYYFDMDFVGCEIDKEYFDKAQKLFKEATAQTKLF